jgi:hypothetical protein
MRLNSWFRLALLVGVAASLPACSYLAGLFPDKQKQYRYSTELPDLEMPPELSADKLSKATAAGKESTDFMGRDKSADEPAAKPAAKKKSRPAKKESDATLAENSSDNAALIELHEEYPGAWNDVSRALGRLRVEITDQNRADGVFYVYYGGVPPKKPEETGFWDDVKSVFSSDSDQAKEYRVKLEDKDDYTFIKVLDQDGKGVSEGPGLELLKRIHKKLLTLNQPEPEGEEGRKADEAERKATEKPGAGKP